MEEGVEVSVRGVEELKVRVVPGGVEIEIEIGGGVVGVGEGFVASSTSSIIDPDPAAASLNLERFWETVWTTPAAINKNRTPNKILALDFFLNGFCLVSVSSSNVCILDFIVLGVVVCLVSVSCYFILNFLFASNSLSSSHCNHSISSTASSPPCQVK